MKGKQIALRDPILLRGDGSAILDPWVEIEGDAEALKKHYWITPPGLYEQLNQEFHFDFDPCPYPRRIGYDGLTIPWGKSNYCNPPFQKGMIHWIRKAISERGQTVLLLPAPQHILALIDAKAELRSAGRVKFLSIEDGEPNPGPGNCILAIINRAYGRE